MLKEIGATSARPDPAMAALDQAARSLEPDMVAVTAAASQQADVYGRLTNQVYTLTQAMASVAKKWQETTGDIRTQVTAEDGYMTSMDALTNLSETAANALTSYGDAVAHAGDQVTTANKELIKSVENLAKAEADLDKVRIDSAQKVADVEVQSAQRIMDAQRRLADSQRTQQHDAEQGAQRIADAKQRLADAEGAANQYTARRQIETAAQARRGVRSGVPGGCGCPAGPSRTGGGDVAWAGAAGADGAASR
jgi:chromosome segregation ATPase